MSTASPIQAHEFTTKVCQLLWDTAELAGTEAATKAVPTPMHVVERANPFDDNSPITRRYAPVMDGACGFAWVNIKPANSHFAKWLVATGKARKDSYKGGVTIWISAYNQSYERKTAHAYAMADSLQQYGIRAYADGRLD